MYVYLKYNGSIEEGMHVGVGNFECQMKLTMPKETFEKKLAKKKIRFENTVIKIEQLEKVYYVQEPSTKEDSNETYILPIGTKIKTKNLFQRIKTLYFG